MDKLSELYTAIERLNPDEFQQLRAFVDQHEVRPRIDEDPKTRAAALMAAFAEMREGMSKAELDEMVAAMNGDTQRKATSLLDAVADFWDGLSQEEIDEIVEDMG